MKLEDYEPLSETAQRLNVSVSLAARWCREKKLPCRKLGFYWLVRRGAEPDAEPRTRRSPGNLQSKENE